MLGAGSIVGVEIGMIHNNISRIMRFIHCLIFWHTPVDGEFWLWCGTCGKSWRR